MSKVDCLLVELDYCSRGGRYGEPIKHLLRYAKLRAQKLVLASSCGSINDVLYDLRILSSDNIDFPLRLYQDTNIKNIIQKENCISYELKKFDDILLEIRNLIA